MTTEIALAIAAGVLLLICLWQQWRMADLRDEASHLAVQLELLSEKYERERLRGNRLGGIIDRARWKNS